VIGPKESSMRKIVTSLLLCLFTVSCRGGEPKTLTEDKGSGVQSDGNAAVETIPQGQIWLPGKASITQKDEKYFLGVTPEEMDIFISKNNLKPLGQWPVMATTSYRGYIPPEEIKKLHANDPLMSGTLATSIPAADGYTAIYYNRDLHYLVVQE
jgi:hypothetical protein